jgi:5-methylcytosine-specific restriction endonuclease McrA
MRTEADELRAALEQRGDVPKMANAESGWFAITPSKWHRLVTKALSEGRDGPTLIVYRTKTTDRHDHYVIPYEVISPLLTTSTSPPRLNGAPRWELTLRAGKLKVTHGGTVDVAAFHRLPLQGAVVTESELATPTADPVVLEARTSVLRKRNLAKPDGNARPRSLVVAGRVVYERRADVKAWILRESGGVCELCRSAAPFVGVDGEPFLELHHVEQLAFGGPDTVENAVALCPNCHRRLHHAIDRHEHRAVLRSKIDRLQPIAGAT